MKRTKKAVKKEKVGIVREVERFHNLGNNDDPYYWRLRAHNGEILAVSEGYDKADDRDDTARAVAKQLRVKLAITEALG